MARKKGTELVAGKFRPGSFKARIYELLADGKPHTRDEIKKAVKGCASVAGRIVTMRKNGIAIEQVQDGAYMLRKPKARTKRRTNAQED